MRTLSLIALLLSLLFAVPVLAAKKDVAKTKTPASTCCSMERDNKASACKYCGMDRDKFAHSRMLLTYEDGIEVKTCSLHCVAVDLANNIDRIPTKVMVGDFNTKTLIDAEKAFWVIDGGKLGVMSNRGKWAFTDRPGAEAYVSANGGTIVTFEQALKAAYEDMYEDTLAIRERRKVKRLKMMEEKKALEEKKEGAK